MPGATHCVADQQTLAKRAAVMRAGGANGEYLAAGPGEEDGIAADLPDDHGAVRHLIGIDTSDKVGALFFALVSAHDVPHCVQANVV